jgi:hypothetical protein
MATPMIDLSKSEIDSHDGIKSSIVVDVGGDPSSHEDGHCPWEESEIEAEDVVLELGNGNIVAFEIESIPSPATVITTPPSPLSSLKAKSSSPTTLLPLNDAKLSITTISSIPERSSNNSFATTFRIYRELWKTNLSTLVVTTTAIGWVASGGELRSKALLGLLGGTFLQSACANR